ncbi:hypothetical protein HPB52_006451 [Rhipicephalus sanguineus]|uniref:Ran gtpase-activating protein n=1 Tax=Rhipicephalus sanguineus TaxID=34632 RepID=A0A9D4PLA3_RHISA|nr:hypothetical protein HPB52_006451 [Rhipicephalus sanguineus]
MAGADDFNPALLEGGDAAERLFTNTLFDSLLPCASTPESSCELAEHLSMLNEVLFCAAVELRETPEPYGQLSLVSLADKEVHMQHEAGKPSQAVALLHHLLKTHSCIDRVYIDNAMLSEYGPLICDALKRSLSIRALSIDIRGSVVEKYVDDALFSMERLEELECLALSSCDELWFFLPNIVRILSSLTTLKIAELRLRGSRARDLVAALKENSTLKELSIHGSVICEAGRGEFAEYLKINTSLITLTIGADDVSRRNCFNWTAEGLLVNEVVKNVNLSNILFDRVNAQLAAQIFSENKTIRSFNVVYCPQALSLQPNTDYNLWHAPLSNNDTLEELSLPFSIWNPEQWAEFFWTAAGKASLKKIAVFVHLTAHRHLQALCKVLKESGAEEKVSLGTYFVRHNVDLVYSKAFSDIDMFCFGDQLVRLVRLLQPFNHITSIRFSVRMGDPLLASSIAAYIQGTTSLQKLLLTLYCDDGDTEENTNTSWTELVGALSSNTSVKELGVYVDINYDDSDEQGAINAVLYQEQVERLAQAMRCSRTIRRVNFGAEHSAEVATFLRCFSEGIADNYVLVGINLCGKLGTQATRDCFKVRDTVRRNCGFLAQATHFIRRHRLDRRSAAALEQVWRHTGLLEELAEQQSLSVAEVTSVVRCGLRSFEGLHDFMRLSCVVQHSVVCEPVQDSSPQLDALNEDCWRLVRRYLVLHDVRRSREPAPRSQH